MNKYAITLVLFPALASAADITWGAPADIAGDSDVASAGVLWAYHFNPVGAGADATVNGVTFVNATGSNADLTFVNPTATSVAFAGSGVFGGSASFNALSAGYRSILGGAAYWDNAPGRLVLNGLTAGATYSVRLWANDSRTVTDVVGRTETLADASGHAVTLKLNQGLVDGSTGAYVDGVFTADALTQELRLSCPAGKVSQVNAIALSQVSAIPEPSAYGLFGAGSAALWAIARRRRSRCR